MSNLENQDQLENTDQIVDTAETTLNSLELLERAIEVKKKSNTKIALFVKKINSLIE